MNSSAVEMGSITECYSEGLKHFIKLNSFFLAEYHSLTKGLQENSLIQKSVEETITAINEMQRSHSLLKQLMASFTTMYNMVIQDCGYAHLQGIEQFSIDESCIFPELKFGEKLSEHMTEKMLEQKRLLQVEDEFTTQSYSQKLRKLEELRKEICDPLPVHGVRDGYDCVGYHPSDSLVAVLSKVIKLNRERPYRILLYKVEKICR